MSVTQIFIRNLLDFCCAFLGQMEVRLCLITAKCSFLFLFGASILNCKGIWQTVAIANLLYLGRVLGVYGAGILFHLTYVNKSVEDVASVDVFVPFLSIYKGTFSLWYNFLFWEEYVLLNFFSLQNAMTLESVHCLFWCDLCCTRFCLNTLKYLDW